MARNVPFPLLDVDALRQDVCEWSRARNEHIHEPAVELVLRFKYEFVDQDLGRWRAGDIDRLLLGVFPQKVTTDDVTLAAVPAAIQAVLRYLDHQGWLSSDGAPLATLLRELRLVAPQLPAAMADTSAYGPAKGLLLAMQSDGVDPTDQGAVELWMREFNARSLAERESVIGASGADREELSPLLLPPVRIAPGHELADAARDSEMLGRLRRLANWIGPRRKLTGTGVLRPVDAKVVCRSLDLLEDPYDEIVVKSLRSARELAPLHRLWVVATECGLVLDDSGWARPGPALRDLDGSDEDVLTVWEDVFTTMVDLGVQGGAERRYRMGYEDQVDDELPGMLCLLYAAGEPLPVVELEAGLWEGIESAYHLDSVPELTVSFWRDGVSHSLGAVLDRLASLGAVKLSPGTVALTPLCTWAVRRKLLASGADAPAVGDLAGRSAAEMLGIVADYDGEDAAAEYTAWLAEREPDAAARAITAAATKGSAAVRAMAMPVLDLIGADAEPAVRAAVSDRLLAPYAKLWLAQRSGQEPGLDPTESLLLLVDVCAGLLDAGEPEAVAEELDALGADSDIPSLLDSLWRVDHPQTVAVLEAVGAHHSDRVTRKYARKSAFKARSRRASG